MKTHTARGIPVAVPTIQLSKIERILKKDADNHRLVAGTFLEGAGDLAAGATKASCESVGRCANGSLLFYSDLPLKKLAKIEDGGWDASIDRFMKREYGLLEIHTSAIIEINDNTDDDKNNGKRYEEVMALLTFAEVMQQQGVRFRSSSALARAYDLDDPEDYWFLGQTF